MYKYLLLSITFFILGCSDNNNPAGYSQKEINEFIDIAWEDLTEQELATVTITKEQAKVYYSTITREDGVYFYQINNNRHAFFITHPEVDYRNDQTFVIIVINTNADGLLGPISVIIEPNSKKAFGRGARL